MPAATQEKNRRRVDDSTAWPLLRGRLQPPVTRSALVSRARVSALLGDVVNFEVVLVVAPSGYGKTTAVAHWLAELQGRDCLAAWVSIDEMECGPTRLLMYLVASLSNCDDRLAEGLEGLLTSNFDMNVVNAIREILVCIEDIGREVYLVIDDLQGSVGDEGLRIFDRLVNHGLRNLHLVLILRETMELPLARARMRRSLLEIGPLELQFTFEEARAYFGLQPDIRLSDEDIGSLLKRTDGWVAGLQLAALSLRGHANPRAFIDGFSGSNRDVADLLGEEVLSSLSDDRIRFLEQSAALGIFNAALCDDLLERNDSAQIIQQLEDGNFFIFPMDTERTRYRYHRLLSEYLVRNLNRTMPGKYQDLHHRAALWYQKHRSPLRACEHAIETGDMQFLAEVLEKSAEFLREIGYSGTVKDYATKLPPDIANRHPRLQLVRIFSLTVSWQFDEARRVLDQVRHALTLGGGAEDDVYEKLIHREGQLALLTDDHRTAEPLYAEWLELDKGKSPFEEAIVRTSQLCSRSERYEFAGLESASDIRKGFEEEGMEWATVWHDAIIGYCHFNRGDLDEAERLYRRALGVAQTLGGVRSATPAMPGLYLAELLYERGELDEAQALIDDHLEIATDMGMVGQLSAGFVTKARLLVASQDEQAALKVLDAGIRISERWKFRRLYHTLMLERYRILLGQIGAEKCYRIARTDGLISRFDRLCPDVAASSFEEPQALAWASINLARGKVAEASKLLDRWRKMLLERGAMRAAVKFSVTGIRAALIMQEKPKAMRLTRELLEFSRKCGFVRSIIDEGIPVLDLVQSLDNESEILEARENLLRKAGRIHPVPASNREESFVVEPLNGRETEILHMVERGLMNKQIAAGLGLTTGTVKWYMQQIFAKLGVRSRAQAIHRSKQLGIVR